MRKRNLSVFTVLMLFGYLFAQGVTTSGLSGLVSNQENKPLVGANVVVTHEPSGTQYGTMVRDGGVYTILNMRVGGPYTVVVSYIGYKTQVEENVFLSLGSATNANFQLVQETIEMEGVDVTAVQDDLMNANRTGAATFVGGDLLAQMPTIKRSTRDLTRLDPRSDGNFSFGGRNWLYNNISLDGSYFNNPFGLDDPAPGGQANAEPVPFDAVEQVQVSVAPFDVREGGFTGAGINTVTKSGTNTFGGSVYNFSHSEALQGNSVAGSDVVADPSLNYNQSGFTLSGPFIYDKAFFFVNYERERRTDPGSNFVADEDGNIEFGESRVSADVMDAIRDRMMDVYGYDTGDYQGYNHETNNDKLLVKLDFNLSANHNAVFRYNMLDASRDLGPHGFVLSYNGTGRGPNSSSLPFENSGYTINNKLHSFAGELNSTFGGNISNRFFFSYNMFRDWRTPKSVDFPTVEIGENGLTYTTIGHEPFSIHNILDQDVLQITNNTSYFMGKHTLTAGVNYEQFKFFNSFNIFRHGLFMLPGDLDLLYPGAGYLDFLGATTYSSLDNFFIRTDNSPENTDFVDFNSMVGSGPFKGELIDVAQLAFYAQDEFMVNEKLNVTAGLRVDIPIYNTEPVANPFSTDSLSLLDENDNPEIVDQAKLPDAKPLYSPRVGFNYDVKGDRSMQLRGGTGIFTGRLPFVWIGNVISNPGNNPNIPGDGSNPDHETDSGEGREQGEDVASVLQQSFDLNAMVDDFEWPQVWTTNLALDLELPSQMLGTFEMVYGKDLNAIYMRNADLVVPVDSLADGRPYFGGVGANELNSFYPGSGEGAYVIDNTDEGYNLTLTGQLRKVHNWGLVSSIAYTYTQSMNNLKSTEIASVLFQSQPVQGDPNKPTLAPSEFGIRHRFIGTANYTHDWSATQSTNVGLFYELAEGNQYVYSGGNRYSHTYAGDVNGDGFSNDLIYIPENADDIVLADTTQWDALNAFIEQDPYLSENRGKIAERHGLVNPWFSNIDLKVLHDYSTAYGKFQFSMDILNLANLLNDEWGVRKVANPMALAPLGLTGWDENGEPILSFNDVEETFIDDPGLFSRWRMQFGIRYIF